MFFKKWKPLILSILISVGVGVLSSFFTSNSMGLYDNLEKPPLSPPGWLFPVVWTILYVLMGISAYLVYRSDSPEKGRALVIYATQLLVNAVWPILFFNLQAYLFAFLWLLLLMALVILMIRSFYKVDPRAAYLQIPYLLWLVFAGYLNLMVYLLNR